LREAMDINQFNSNLLTSVSKYYKGPFHQKISSAFSIPQWDSDLGKACGSLFKISGEEIQEPNPSMIANYGGGEIGNDYVVTLYADHHLGKIIDLIRQEDVNFQSIKSHLDALDFLRASKVSISGPKDLFFRKILVEGFRDWSRLNSLRSEHFNAFENEPPVRASVSPDWEVKESEDLSFLGILSMLSVFLTGIEKKMGRVKSQRIFKIFPYTRKQDPSWLSGNQNFFPLNQAANNQAFKSDTFFPFFEKCNNRYIANTKQDLPLSMSNILSSSSFLWGNQIFGIDPAQLEAMSEEQRVRFLLKKKNAIIEQCFDYLSEGMPDGATAIDLASMYFKGRPNPEFRDKKLRSLRISTQIVNLLKEIESLEKLLARTSLSRQNAKESLTELIGGISGEYDETQIEAELLKLLEANAIPPEVSDTRTGQLIGQLADQYRKQTILQATYKEQLAEKGNSLKPLKKQLADIYASVANDYLDYHTGNQAMLNRLLEVHTVFSYFVFNKEIFPDISFSNLTKQGLKEKVAARKILSFFRKDKQQKTSTQAIKGTVQEFLNDTSKHIFEQFTDAQKGKTRALTPAETKQILAVSRDISENPQSFEKFQKLEKILKSILIEDQAFTQNCSQLATSISIDQVIQLQTYMNASLLFIEGKKSTAATGLKRSVGFRKLAEAIQVAQVKDHIDNRGFTSQPILDQLRNFNYPPEVTNSFTKNIQTVYRKLTINQINQVDLAIVPVDLKQFPQMQQKKAILEEMRAKILELSPKGENSFLSEKEKHLNPTFASEKTQMVRSGETIRGSDAIDSVFSSGTYINKYLKNHYRGMLFSYDQLLDALRSFSSREEVGLGLFSSSEWSYFKRRTSKFLTFGFNRKVPDDVYLATIIALYEEIHQEYNQQLRSLENLNATQIANRKTPISEKDRANVFEGTELYRRYNRNTDNFSKNYELSQDLYQKFLPLFLTSYLADVNNLSQGRVYLSQQKMEALKGVFPGVERLYGEMNAFLTSQSRKFTELKEFFRAQESQAGFLEEGFLTGLKDFFSQNFPNPIAGLENFAFHSILATLGLLMYTRSPVFAALGGLAISYFWETGVKPVLKDMYNLLIEGGRNILGYNSAAGINDYILNLFNVAFETEIRLAQTENLPGRKRELNDLFLNGLFLQEELSILKNSKISLIEFRNRLQSLVPSVVKNSNFSVLILNMFFKLNEPGFLAAPNNLLRNAGHPQFTSSIQEYFTAYQNLINQEKAAFVESGHTEEECVLDLGVESPFKTYLTEKAKGGELTLSFPMNSSMYQFMGEQYIYLENPFRSQIEPSQINQGLPSFGRNLEAFLQTAQQAIELEEQFLGAIRPVVLRTRSLITLSPNYMRNAEDALRSNYMMFKYTFDLARKLDTLYFSGATNESDRWISSTNERGQSLFLSPLYREISSNLMKTAQFMDLSGVEEGSSFLSVMKEIQSRVKTYLEGGALLAPTNARILQMESAVASLMSKLQEEPQVAFPVIYEKAQNPMSELPIFLWRLGRESVAREMGEEGSAIAIRNANNSDISYLVNGGIELFFTTAISRGFSLSPMVLNALEEAFKQNTDYGALVFLGAMSQREQARLRALEQVPRSIDVDALQQESYRNIARQRGQPLMLMPPAQQSQQNTTIPQQGMQQPQSPIAQPSQQQNEQSPAFQNASQSPQTPYAASQGNPMIQGQQNPQQATGAQNMPIGGAEGPLGAVQGTPQRQQQQGAQSGSNFMPLLMPYGQNQTPQGASEGPMPLPQEQEVTPQTQEQTVPQATPRNYVTVTSDGSTAGTTSATNVDDPERQWAPWEEAERSSRLAMEENRRNPPPLDLPGIPPSQTYRGPMNMDDFWGYQEAQAAQQRAQFPYGKAAAVGGGLMLGAALLASMMKKDDKEEDKKL